MELLEFTCTPAVATSSVVVTGTPTGVVEAPFVTAEVTRTANVCLTLASLNQQPEVHIRLRLRAASKPAGPIRIEGMPRETGALPGVLKIDVKPEEWIDNQCAVTISADATALRHAGVGEYRLVWDWHFANSNASDLQHFAASELLLFVTIGPPRPPWSPEITTAPDLVTPWPTALALACLWARGATTTRDAARMIAQQVIALGDAAPAVRLQYSAVRAPRYRGSIVMPMWFDCELFIADMNGPVPASPLGANCIELTAIIVSFANLLGCSLSCLIIDGPKCGVFSLNRVLPLGQQNDKYMRDFANHLIAVEPSTSGNLSDALVYDATQKISMEADPSMLPALWRAVDGLPLGMVTDGKGTGRYLPQLLAPQGLAQCTLTAVAPIRLRAPIRQEAMDACTMARIKRRAAELSAQTDALPPGAWLRPTVRMLNFAAGPTTQEDAPVRGPTLPPLPVKTVVHYRATAVDADPAYRIEHWSLRTAAAARGLMAELLGSSEIPMVPVDVTPGIAYRLPDGRMVLWLVGNTVAQISTLDARVVDLASISWS
jgi:hypothetical protein